MHYGNIIIMRKYLIKALSEMVNKTVKYILPNLDKIHVYQSQCEM